MGVEWLAEPAGGQPNAPPEVPPPNARYAREGGCGQLSGAAERADEHHEDEPLRWESAAMRSQTLCALSLHHRMWLTPTAVRQPSSNQPRSAAASDLAL